MRSMFRMLCVSRASIRRPSPPSPSRPCRDSMCGTMMMWQRAWFVGLLALVCASDGVAQSPPAAFDPATLRRPIYTWTQPEREFGFAHWDAVYAARMVARGARVRPLPAGKPIAALRPGTPGGQALERFIRDQQVA